MKPLLTRLLSAAAIALAAVVPAVALAPPASAHDQVVSTSPADGAVAAAPTKVSVTFSEPVLKVAGANRIVVTGPAGPLNGDLTVSGTVITLTFAGPLPGGSYRAQWRAASDDGHPVSGTFAFSVRAAATTTPPMSTATAAGTPTVTASATPDGATTTPATSAPATQPTSSGSGWAPWLLGALVLAALVATALIVSAKRRVRRDDEPRPPEEPTP
ncbi:MAG: copper resistance CopC family protein [Angustibacter sp.]